MNEFEETLNRVLSDPAQMEQITRLAGQLMGGGDSAPAQEGAAFPDAGMLGQLQGLMSSLGGEKSSKAALLDAMSPYLREDRRQKLQKALRLAKAARIAGVALRETGGEGSV